MANNQKKLKAFVRYDGSGRVVASSLILRKNKPRVGRWFEIPEYLCCNGTSPSTTTTTTNGGGVTPTAWVGQITNSGPSDTWKWNACNGFGTSIIVYTSTTTITGGTFLYLDASLTTPIPYSNGAIVIQGTVYDIVNGAINPLGGNGQPCGNITTTTSTTTTTYTGQYYNADYSSSAACAGTGAFSLPLIVDPNACSNGSITLASGVYSDYGVNNGSTIYINLQNGSVIQAQVFGGNQMSFGCTAC